MIRYFDASAWVKRYVQEDGSSFVRQLLADSVPAANRLTQVEVASALIRRAREGALTPADRDRALNALGKDFDTMYVVEVLPGIGREAISLLSRYPLRSHDAIQLAGCLYLQRRLGAPIELVAYDVRLTDAARSEGLALSVT
jgi:predicted nucleic acid-binding protein